jgi:hypothetical protein
VGAVASAAVAGGETLPVSCYVIQVACDVGCPPPVAWQHYTLMGTSGTPALGFVRSRFGFGRVSRPPTVQQCGLQGCFAGIDVAVCKGDLVNTKNCQASPPELSGTPALGTCGSVNLALSR